jgi:ATP-dependent exoDNAse (exonuclease V) beta subunit
LESTDERAVWIAARRAVLDRAGDHRVVAATRLSGLAAEEVGAEADGAEAEPPPTGVAQPELGPGRRAGTAIGRAVHAVLQTVDLDDPAPALDAVAGAAAAAEGIAGAGGEVAALARSVLAAPTVQSARATRRRWREVYVAAPFGDRVLEGYVDLVVEGPDGSLTVVDYKTDHARSDVEVDEAVARYRLQGAAYAAALEAVLGRPVGRCVFVFARAAGAVERELSDLPEAVEAVRRLLVRQ